MNWIKRPIPDVDGFRTKTMLYTGTGTGFTGGSLFTDESILEPDFRKSKAMDSSVIFETSDDWKSMRKVFQSNGEIAALFKTGPKTILAQNQRSSIKDLHESVSFISFENSTWSEVSHLDQKATRVWSSGESWLIAAGYAGSTEDSIRTSFTKDGGKSWQETSLAGHNPLAGIRNQPLYLNQAGFLFRAGATLLEQLDLNQPEGSGRWEKVQLLPANFKVLGLAGHDKSIWAFGSLMDKKFGMLHFGSSTGDVQECRGIPPEFIFTGFTMSGNLFQLVGAEELQNGKETIGFKNLLLESRNNGGSWINLDLPIKGSLNSYDFGSDGRVWAVAAGNRVQVLVR